MVDKEIDTTRTVLSYDAPITHGRMMRYIEILSERYSTFHVSFLGESVLGKSIPIITLGKGRKSVLYIGTHHGMEWITTALLLKFANEYCELLASNGHVGHTSISYLNSSRTIQIIPMLNPDGADYSIVGVTGDNPLRERVISMNGGSPCFDTWQANARGVDLNHNYNAGFEEYRHSEYAKASEGGAPTKWCGEAPESEPESGLLANYARFSDDIGLFISLHSQGEEIYYGDHFDPTPEILRAASAISSLSGYKLCKTEGSAASGGFTDWVVKELRRPCFTIECGKGTNPLPINSLFEIYYKLRRMFFEAPMII